HAESEPVELHSVLAVQVHGRRRVGARRGLALPAGRESVRGRVRGKTCVAPGSDARRCGHDVSRVSRAIEDTAGRRVRGAAMTLRALSTGLTALLVGGFAAVVALGPVNPAGAQDGMIRTPKQLPLPRNPGFSRLAIETLHVQGNVYMLAGAGANVAVQVGEQGVLVVDTGFGEMSGKLLAAIRELSDKPI